MQRTMRCIDFQHTSVSDFYRSTVMVKFPDGRIVQGTGEGQRNGRIVQGTGEGQRRANADIAAAQDALDQVDRIYPYLLVDWAKLSVEAQAGDALIKLGVYLSPELKSTAAKSNRLQNVETNAHLAKVFDRWKAQNDPRLAIWGRATAHVS
jgi:hypothetical protein